MKKLFLFAILLISIAANAQKKWGIGVRLGDPSGITLKKYFGSSALELNVGRTRWFNDRGWYDRRFNDWYTDKRYDYDDYQYIGYRSAPAIAVQLHYLFRKSLNKVAGESASGLEWYLGVGGQLRNHVYYYNYRYKVKGSNNWVYVGEERINNFDLGVDGVIGLEYRFKDAPISVFGDVTLFMEVLDDPFLFSFQGGIGLRYNF